MTQRILGVLLGLIAGITFSSKATASATALADTPESSVRMQLSAATWPIRTAIPDADLSDLEPLGQAIGTARIVGMGEATHGTSEFFSIKDRILRYLVEQKRFTVLAMEIPWTQGLAIDDYVTTGKGNVRALLADTFPVWDNQEVDDLIEWMRAYNLAPGTHPTLHFVGIDMQDDPTTLTRIIARYLNATDSAQARAAAKSLSCLSRSSPAPECVAKIASVTATLASQPRPTNVQAVNRLLLARHASAIAAQIAGAKFVDDAARDRAMADNVEWFSNTEYPDSRIALWAHDAHVMATPNGSLKTMGTYLRAAYGGDYYVVGFAFDVGAVSLNGVNAPITVAPAPATAIESELRGVGLPIFGLNLHSISTDSLLGAYLSTPKPMRFFGAIDAASDATDAKTLTTINVKSAFDTLIFVEQSHAAKSFRVTLDQSSTPQSQQATGPIELTGQQILDKAVDVWENQRLPPYEAFTLPCHELLRKGADGTCGSSTQMRVTLRTSDDMVHVETIPTDGGKPTVLESQGHLYGPAYAPLGFTRKFGGAQYTTSSLGSDPIAQLKTIATVSATNTIYDVTATVDVCNGSPAYSLTLMPRIQVATHPLRSLVVLRDSFKVCALTYAIPFNGAMATVQYVFEDRGDPPIPFIVRISAQVPYRTPIGIRYTNSTEAIEDISFPQTSP